MNGTITNKVLSDAELYEYTRDVLKCDDEVSGACNERLELKAEQAQENGK